MGLYSVKEKENKFEKTRKLRVDEGEGTRKTIIYLQMMKSLDINEGITYGSSNSKYYSYIGVTNPDNRAVFEETEVSFKSGEECITELKK